AVLLVDWACGGAVLRHTVLCQAAVRVAGGQLVLHKGVYGGADELHDCDIQDVRAAAAEPGVCAPADRRRERRVSAAGVLLAGDAADGGDAAAVCGVFAVPRDHVCAEHADSDAGAGRDSGDPARAAGGARGRRGGAAVAGCAGEQADGRLELDVQCAGAARGGRVGGGRGGH
ncbi:hypothetical protein LPJ70_006690, partial [Coemansia sp. RSA 2708]